MSQPDLDTVERRIDEIRAEHAPDPRLVVFEVVAEESEGRVRVAGVTSSRAAEEALERRLGEAGAGADVAVSVLGADRRAVVLSPAAPIHAKPSIRSTQVSQAVLGAPLRVFRRKGRWLQCRFEDGYLGWVHQGYVARVTAEEAERWTDAVSLVSLGAEATIRGETILPLPWGARVAEIAPHRVMLPDLREVEVAGDLIPISELPERFPHEAAAVPETAQRWIGSPYLWGGRTRGGVDCSGFVQNLFAMHGIVLPRDSDQQAKVGAEASPGEGFEALQPGDLLFFGAPGRPITHVALSEGGSRIVHAFLGRGGVCRTDLNDPIDRETHLPEWFRGARRLIGSW